MDKLLLLMLADEAAPKAPKEIRDIGLSVGLRDIRKWNISDVLARSKGLAISVTDGWEVSEAGIAHLSERGLLGGAPIAQPAIKLRALLPSIKDAQIRSFVEEAISCYEHRSYRAATVLSWVGAAALLYEHVLAKKLPEFNAELKRRFPKQKQVAAFDDFSEIKEADFLDILQVISVIGKSKKDELKHCLQLRNGCGHPNQLGVGEHMVAAHLESLVKNIYSVF